MDTHARLLPLVGIRQAWVFAAAAALALALLPALSAPAGAQEEEDRSGLEHACPEGQVPPAGFTDTVGNPHEHAIECAAWWGIARGGPGARPATEYGPAELVRRDQMASFIARLIDESEGEPLPEWDEQNRFPDVSEDNVHVANINRLAEAEVVLGHPDGTYRPADAVRRDQMASFIARAIEYVTGVNRASDTDHFDDVAEDNVHRRNINGLAEEGIVLGVAPRVYAPANPVRRDAMAAFVMRAMDLHVEENFATVPDDELLPETPDATPEPSTTTQSVTAAPELLEVETVAAEGDSVSVRFTFDTDVDPDELDLDGFLLYGLDTDTQRFLATGAAVDPDDASAVIAEFNGDDFDVATTAAVAHGAVQDADERGNPERALGLKAVTVGGVEWPQGGSRAPRLMAGEVSQLPIPLPGVFEVTWRFDKPVEDGDPSFVAYQEDGDRITESPSSAGGIGNCSVDGTEVTCHVLSDSAPVLVAVQHGTVTNAENGVQHPSYEQARAAAA